MDKLLNLIDDIITESIDIYNLSDLETNKNVDLELRKDSKDGLECILKFKNFTYIVKCEYTFNKYTPVFSFGVIDSTGKIDTIDYDSVLKLSNVSFVIASIFSILKYWVEKYKIEHFQFSAKGTMRQRLYKLYLNKHFSNYTLEDEFEIEPDTIQFTYQRKDSIHD